jgi:hypothetical protein
MGKRDKVVYPDCLCGYQSMDWFDHCTRTRMLPGDGSAPWAWAAMPREGAPGAAEWGIAGENPHRTLPVVNTKNVAAAYSAPETTSSWAAPPGGCGHGRHWVRSALVVVSWSQPLRFKRVGAEGHRVSPQLGGLGRGAH